MSQELNNAQNIGKKLPTHRNSFIKPRGNPFAKGKEKGKSKTGTTFSTGPNTGTTPIVPGTGTSTGNGFDEAEVIDPGKDRVNPKDSTVEDAVIVPNKPKTKKAPHAITQMPKAIGAPKPKITTINAPRHPEVANQRQFGKYTQQTLPGMKNKSQFKGPNGTPKV